MRKALCTLVLVGVFGLAALAGWGFEIGAEPVIDKAVVSYQRFAAQEEEALLTNMTGGPVVGLRVTFSAPVAPITAVGIAASVEIVSSDGGVLVLSGDIPASGTVSLEWPLGSGDIVAAEWLRNDGVAVPVDLGAPMAIMRGIFTAAVVFEDLPCICIEASLSGRMSQSRDGGEIVRYLWTWSDGVTQEGPNVARIITYELLDDVWEVAVRVGVTLTVWNSAGQRSTVTHVAHIQSRWAPAS
jgi:hypothetical protein